MKTEAFKAPLLRHHNASAYGYNFLLLKCMYREAAQPAIVGNANCAPILDRLDAITLPKTRALIYTCQIKVLSMALYTRYCNYG
ncbi:unnamed protein product [Sphenostylis stenocarpa]|uniref:Uncharacterized protein n=1 Tax=Sphenostylis stenocarpa TaxID=92480 RepID=A0AA86VE63_9FABA|nr:unnamed protein product [Sphenostylis stenocarpa]